MFTVCSLALKWSQYDLGVNLLPSFSLSTQICNYFYASFVIVLLKLLGPYESDSFIMSRVTPGILHFYKLSDDASAAWHCAPWTTFWVAKRQRDISISQLPWSGPVSPCWTFVTAHWPFCSKLFLHIVQEPFLKHKSDTNLLFLHLPSVALRCL